MSEVNNYDHLTSLPPEILQHIISYLFESHWPRKTYVLDRAGSSQPPTADYHVTFSRVLFSCKRLNQELDRWCRHFFNLHQAIIQPSSRRQQLAIDKNPTAALVTWIRRHCIWCGKNSVRDAIMMNGMKTCTKCDREHWPDKITLTEAKRDDGLNDEQLSLSVTVKCAKTQLLLPRFGMYKCMSTITTMFFRHEIESLSEIVFINNSKKLERLRQRRALGQQSMGPAARASTSNSATQT